MASHATVWGGTGGSGGRRFDLFVRIAETHTACFPFDGCGITFQWWKPDCCVVTAVAGAAAAVLRLLIGIFAH